MTNITVKRDAKKYSQALLDLAREKNIENIIYQNMEELHQFYVALLKEGQQSKIFSSLLKIKQIKILNQIFSNLKTHDLIKNISLLLVNSNKVSVLEEIIFNWFEISESYKGKIKVEIISAIPLNDSQKQTIINNLKNHIGSNFYMSNKVDTTILGGLVFYIGNKMYDDSLKGKISKIKSNI